MWSSSSRRGGKTTMLQPFPQQHVERWKAYAKQLPQGLLVDVWDGRTAHAQLASLKKLVGGVGRSAESGSLSAPLLLVLVEMHTVCLSRHPLQRAITSLLQGLPDPHRDTVVDQLHSTIEAALTGGWLASHAHCLQYLEALGENFALGELALWKQFPLVVQYCVSVIESCHDQNMLTDSLFIVALKTFMALLHKAQSLVCGLLSGDFSFQFSSDAARGAVTWPVEQRVQSAEAKVQWVTGLLETAKRVCEHLLKTGGVVPHDLSLTAAMLYVVILLRTSGGSEHLNTSITSLTSDWLKTTGSPLNAFPRLAMCHALLAKLPPSSLLVDGGGKPCLLQLFPIISQLFNSFTETSDRYIAARTIALWTTTAKHCARLLSEGDSVYEALLPSSPLINSVLKYVWALWEDPVDGIRHQCKLMFENVVEICQQLQVTESPSPSSFLLTLTNSLLCLTSPTRGKYQLLSTLSHHLPITTLLLTAPTLPTELLGVMGHQALACHAGELWSRLVKLHWDKGQDSTARSWSKTWVDTVVQFMVSASPLSRQHVIQHCLPCLFECCPDSMDLIRSSLRGVTSATADARLTTELACLRCAKSHLADFSWDQSHESTFIAATHHRDEQIQLSALGVLCESVRSTEPLPPSSLPLLLSFLSLNGSTQSPNFRYPIITAIKKLLLRIRDSSYALRKQHSKKKGPDPHSTIKSYQAFLQSLVSQQLSCLHPFSSYQRRHMALSLLQLLSAIFPSSPTPSTSENHDSSSPSPAGGSSGKEMVIGPMFEFPRAVSVDQAQRLVLSLRDSYDANRALVLQLLCCLPQETLGLEDSAFLKHLTTSFHKFMCSPKAVDCTTASYLLRLLLQTKPTQFNHLLQDLISGSERLPESCILLPESVAGEFPHWVTVSLLLSLLAGQLERARGDLLAASVQDSLYGVMQSIRTTLEEAREMSCDLEVCRAVIELCGEVATLASPVVCNSSPEGFLPGTQGIPGGGSLEAPTVEGAGAQSLLLCCWHAMKETSLLMGLLVEWAPIGDSPHSVLTPSQVDRIASIFTNQLTEARHRGAFEMAYSGFQKLCQSLWGSPCHQFQQMPGGWVGQLLDSLQSTSMSHLLSITRRSAGLPFYLQAILTSEPGHTGRPCLKKVMRTLLSVAGACKTADTASPTAGGSLPEESSVSGPSSNGQPAVQPHSASVHALNILRALYRDSRLGEHVTPFIPEGVEIAVHGFSASLWPIRNSSTLLFSALVLRIFGAKRVQDEHSIENKMTAREFFTRFPTLHGFLQEELHIAAKQLESSDRNMQQSLQLSLFPVLLILSRLYPTTLDEPTSPSSLHSFLPLLLQCSSCAVWKTRVLISRAVVPLATPHNVGPLLQDLLGKITTADQNSLHTALLTLKRLVQERGDLLGSTGHKSSSGPWLSVWLLESLLKRETLGTRKNRCPVTRCAYLELVTRLLVHHSVKKEVSALMSVLLSPLLQEAELTLFTSSEEDVLVSSANLLFSCSSHQSLEVTSSGSGLSRVSDLCQRCLVHPCPAVRQHTLLSIDQQDLLSQDTGDKLTTELVQLFSTEADETLLAQLCNMLTKHRNKLCSKTQRVLCEVALRLVTQTHLRLELRVSLILFLSSMSENSYDHEVVVKWLSLVEQYTLPTAPVELRQAVAVGLGGLWRILVQVESLQMVEPYSLLVVGLLQDGDEEVRDDMATSVGAILSSLPPSVGKDMVTQNPSSSSALQSYLSSLPLILHQQPLTAIAILLHLVDLESIQLEKSPRGNSNMLFEEDPLNNYMEEIRVLTAACEAVETLLAGHCCELLQSVVSLTRRLQTISKALIDNHERGGYLSRWDQPQVFLGLCKVSLLSEAVVKGLHQAGCSHQQLNEFVSLKLL